MPGCNMGSHVSKVRGSPEQYITVFGQESRFIARPHDRISHPVPVLPLSLVHRMEAQVFA